MFNPSTEFLTSLTICFIFGSSIFSKSIFCYVVLYLLFLYYFYTLKKKHFKHISFMVYLRILLVCFLFQSMLLALHLLIPRHDFCFLLYFISFCIILLSVHLAQHFLPYETPIILTVKTSFHSSKFLGSRLLYHKSINFYHIPAWHVLLFVSFVGGCAFFLPTKALERR